MNPLKKLKKRRRRNSIKKIENAKKALPWLPELIQFSLKSPTKRKKKHYSNKAPHNTSQIKCYNCYKMGHYTTICPEPKN